MINASRLFSFDRICFLILFFFIGALVLLFIAAAVYLDFKEFRTIFQSADLRFAMRLSLLTSTLSAVLAVLVAIPVSYCLSRFHFPGRLLLDTIVDIPIVLPPLVFGLCLLVFFRTPLGQAIENTGLRFVYQPAGIVLSQFFIISPYAVRTVKASFDSMNTRIEDVARTLGYSRFQVFVKVTLPMIKDGIIAGGVIAWAVAIGLFGPMMVFVGTTRRRTEVLATSIYLELSVGRVQTALGIAFLMIIFSVFLLVIFKRFSQREVPLGDK